MTQSSEDERALLELVRDFAAERLVPRVPADEEAGRFPREVFDELGRMDLLGLPFAQAHGGSGLSYASYLRVVEELSRAFLTVGIGLSVHTLATWAVATYGGDEVRRELLPEMTAGRMLGAYALSEPGSGSDAAGLVTRAVLEGDAYVVDGVKAWVTHAGHADFYVLMCRTSQERTRGVSALLVPAGTSGMSFPPPERKMGMRSSPTGQIVFERAKVPARNLLGAEGQGLSIALRALDGGRLGIAACSTGVAQAALDHAVAYALQRRQFGRAIGEFQGVAFILADMAAGIEAARALWIQTAELRDAGEPFGPYAAMAKLIASDTAMRATTDAVQILGGYGYTTDYPVERLMREAKALQIVEGTNQVQRVVIARALLTSRRRDGA
jgi:hypothetical protein